MDHPLVEFVGEIDDREKDDFLGLAYAYLFPIDWPEPFGITMIEAMATGAPVIAMACGSVPEVVLHGVTGFRSEEHTSELQSLMRISYAVFCLKKNTNNT